MNALEPVERTASLADRVYQLLREYLRSGSVKWGEVLREGALAARFRVSRTPVREALGRLASEGLVEPHGRSFTVPSLTGEDLEDIYELRVLLETEAVRQAAARGADSEVKQALGEAQHAFQHGDAEAFIRANRRFRAGWLSLARNRRLVRMVELYADHVRALQFLTLGDKARQQVVLQGMQAIFQAIHARDAEAAAQAMRHYLGISREAMLQAAGRMTSVARSA
ncbi:MAG TPA: GntR family transcriptional regulator [Burkholderiales bacterium]|jgi:DNA-binding GntR family transcriptional regulator|nr:GntR family transcriptional regulator [Burkholderiales bacterium]